MVMARRLPDGPVRPKMSMLDFDVDVLHVYVLYGFVCLCNLLFRVVMFMLLFKCLCVAC